jgi:hypothetical protein
MLMWFCFYFPGCGFLKSDAISNSNKISKTNEVFVSSDGNQVMKIEYFKVVNSTNTAVNTGTILVCLKKEMEIM